MFDRVLYTPLSSLLFQAINKHGRQNKHSTLKRFVNQINNMSWQMVAASKYENISENHKFLRGTSELYMG